MQPSSTNPSQSSSTRLLQTSTLPMHCARHTPFVQAVPMGQSLSVMHALGLLLPPSVGTGKHSALAHAWPIGHGEFGPQVLLTGGTHAPFTQAKLVGQFIVLVQAVGCTTHTWRMGSHEEP